MNQVVIVDDDMIVRVTLRSLVNWENFGFTVAADFNGGKAALEYFRENRADLLIVDMKMPDLNGISLMECLQKEGKLPVTIALSGYNEFELVREAFRLGAFDYLLKSDLTSRSLKNLLEKLNQKIFFDGIKAKQGHAGFPEKKAAFGFEELSGLYGVVLFSLDDARRQAARFGEDLSGQLQKPVLELARQLPRIAARGILQSVDPFHYVLAYKAGDPLLYRHTILSVVRQLQSVWQDYMNLSLSAAVSDPYEQEGLYHALEENGIRVKLCVLSGRGGICTEWDCARELKWFLVCRKEEKGLVSALYSADPVLTEQEKTRFFSRIQGMGIEEGKACSLALIALLAEQFDQYEDDFFSLFSEEISYREKFERISSGRELELWLNNYFRWVTDYTENRSRTTQANMISKARHFLADNYANPELTLKSAADFVGLNEKYFSSRFTKESGMTFSAYLTDLRMQKAKKLVLTTDLKLYEISERVGYHNVEHFNRMFKRSFGISPGDYRKSGGVSSE